jgi:hypothetical protein
VVLFSFREVVSWLRVIYEGPTEPDEDLFWLDRGSPSVFITHHNQSVILSLFSLQAFPPSFPSSYAVAC